jgi:hypothetical protein
MEMEKEQPLFILHWIQPCGDAVVIALCEYCGAERFSSEENLRTARNAKMHICCLSCFFSLAQDQQCRYGGRIRHGAVIENRSQRKKAAK